MLIAIIYNEITIESSLDDKDVLAQVEIVDSALKLLGYKTTSFALTLDFSKLKHWLMETKPNIVFNLVESIDKKDMLSCVFSMFLDSYDIKYTGSSTKAIFYTSNKLEAKKILINNNLKTPIYFSLFENINLTDNLTWIIKSIYEHASAGLYDDKVINESPSNLKKIIKHNEFAEEYIDGREFNVAILANKNKPEVLPCAEIIFKNYDKSKPKIVGYLAKWQQNSYEYNNTLRTFEFLNKDKKLLKEIEELSVKCWNIFGLRGYARVDFRVDHNNVPYILEINTNPCLSEDAGFLAAAKQANLTVQEVMERIINDI